MGMHFKLFFKNQTKQTVHYTSAQIMNNTLIITCQTVDNRYLLSAPSEAVAVCVCDVSCYTDFWPTDELLLDCFNHWLEPFCCLNLTRQESKDLGCEGHLPLGLVQLSSYIHWFFQSKKMRSRHESQSINGLILVCNGSCDCCCTTKKTGLIISGG